MLSASEIALLRQSKVEIARRVAKLMAENTSHGFDGGCGASCVVSSIGEQVK